MNYIDTYVAFLKKQFDLKRPLKIVCDSSNGTTGIILRELKNIPNLELILINDDANGDFPAHGPNPLVAGAADQISKKILETGADLGAIFDADGDRAFMVDEKGMMFQSFITSVLLFKNNKPPFACDELVYQSLVHMKMDSEFKLFPSKIGSLFVKEQLLQSDASVGSEYSGHYYYKAFFGVDAGIYTMIQVANTLSTMTETLSEFNAKLPPQFLHESSVKIQDKKWEDILQKVKSTYDGKASFGYRDGITLNFDDAWVSIRPSNTEPIVKFIAGAKTKEAAASLVNNIKTLV